MKADIKCLECGKMTRHVEPGRLFYTTAKPSERVIIENAVICPKCKKDLSGERFLLKKNYFMISLLAANVCLSIGEKVPEHLAGAFPVTQHDYDLLKLRCKSRPQLVGKF